MINLQSSAAAKGKRAMSKAPTQKPKRSSPGAPTVFDGSRRKGIQAKDSETQIAKLTRRVGIREETLFASARVIALREWRELSQKDLADRLGLSIQQISGIETNIIRLGVQTAIALCELTGVELNWLLSGNSQYLRSDVSSQLLPIAKRHTDRARDDQKSDREELARIAAKKSRK